MPKFAFENVQQLWEMAGHGPYVWVSYGITFFVLFLLAVVPYLQHKAFIKSQVVIIKREQAQSSQE